MEERKTLIGPNGYKYLDLTNQRHGMLTVVKPLFEQRGKDGSIMWLCKCDCGKERIESASNINRRQVTSCGCYFHKKENYDESFFGKKFGKLTVLRYATKDDFRPKLSILKTTAFYCQCECGRQKAIRAVEIVKRRISSCGCARVIPVRKNLDREDVLYRHLYRTNVIRPNKKRGIVSDITFSQFKQLVSQNCFYCGCPPNNMVRDVAGSIRRLVSDTIVKYHGLDQKSPNLGYFMGNVVPCCWTCNSAKNSSTQEEFFSQIKTWSTHLKDYIKDVEELDEPVRKIFHISYEKDEYKFISDEEMEKFKNLTRSRELWPGEFEPSI